MAGNDAQVVECPLTQWTNADALTASMAIDAVEAGKVLYLPKLRFRLLDTERLLMRPALLAEGSRNISLDATGTLKGASGTATEQAALREMIARFGADASGLIRALMPEYTPYLRLAPTSFRPARVEGRAQSWRADDRRLHVDAFPSRPNRGERILRVFANVNPDGVARVWRVGEPFEAIARTFLPRASRYRPSIAWLMNQARITKSMRSEYDHLMLQLHDGMKRDLVYQSDSAQITMPFAAGSTWICFSDQASHAVMSGQFMLEQTFHLPAARQYNSESSPLAILSRQVGRSLIE